MHSAVRRIRRSDEDGFIVLRAQQTQSDRLDVDLLATDGEAPYLGNVEHATASKLLNKAYDGSSQDWQVILLAVLLADHKSLSAAAAQSIEVSATIQDTRLILSIRKNIDGITQRLGEIGLERNDDAEISLYDWTAESASKSLEMQHDLRHLESKLAEKERSLAKLEEQIQQFIAESEMRDSDLARRFTALLSTKKARINDQQRVLSKNGVSAKDIKMTDRPQSRSNKGPSRAKRKPDDEQQEKSQIIQEDEAASDASEASQRTETPDAESDDEQEIGKDLASSPSAARKSQDSPRKGRTTVPPRRELPFAAKSKTRSAETSKDESRNGIDAAAAHDSDETEDEL